MINKTGECKSFAECRTQYLYRIDLLEAMSSRGWNRFCSLAEAITMISTDFAEGLCLCEEGGLLQQ